ncbi:DUF927 domain-containing protein [Paraburkholderia unamae]|uniref:DUF927 domain-containing protein n=1 Tax=Paraburkholderia unamae TaxID=219649 RepID=A0ACC6RH46_9BURK
MDTLQFLQAILPAEGKYILAVQNKNGPGFHHRLFDTIPQLANACLSNDKAGEIVYYACASFTGEHIETPDRHNPGKMKKSVRKQELVHKVKAFWIDIDCGADKADEGKGYATKGDALKALQAFCANVGLKLPMIVDSGGGLHCYWPLTRDIGPKSWTALAEAFKRLLAEEGLLADPSRTADRSSVLRPVGTHNRKPGREERVVTLKHPGQGPYTPEEFREKLGNVDAPTAFDAALPAHLRGVGASNGLAAQQRQFLPASARKCAERCQQIQLFRDGASMSEPSWRAAMSVVVKCTEGAELAHEWSSADSRYNYVETQEKIDNWQKPPATCQQFFDHYRAGCDGCQFRGLDGSLPDFKSPIKLGEEIPEPKPEAVMQVEVETPEGEVQTVEYTIPEKPAGFDWDGFCMTYTVMDEDDVPKTTYMSNTHFYVYGWSSDGEKHYAQCRAHKPRGGVVEFNFPFDAISGPAETVKVLSSGSIMPTSAKNAANALSAYMRASIDNIKRDMDDNKVYRSFGWTPTGDGIVIGHTLYKSDGTEGMAYLGGSAQTLGKHFTKQGTVEGYADAVNSVYNRRGMEPMQYAYCAGFGSLLTPLAIGGFKGCTLAITGGKSGRGKTTVASMALEAFGDSAKLTRTKSDTIKSFYGTMAAMGNLPILFDEFTSLEPDEVSAWAYSITEGAERSRMQSTSTGVKLAETGTWALSPYVTGNSNMYDKLAAVRLDAHAEAARILQISTDVYAIPSIEPSGLVKSAFDKARANRGVAGEAFAKYILANKAAVTKLVIEYMEAYEKVLPEQTYRFWVAHAACTMAAATVLRNIGVIAFDLKGMLNWTRRLFTDLVAEVTEKNTVDEDDILARFINEISPQTIVTSGYVAKPGYMPEEVRTYHEVAARYVLGNVHTEAKYHGKLIVSRVALRTWCSRNRVAPDVLLSAAKGKGAIVYHDVKMNLTKGTTAAPVNTNCVVLDATKLGGEVALPSLQSVPSNSAVAV